MPSMETSAEHFSKEAATYDTTKPLLALLTEQAARELLERGLATPDTVGCAGN